MHKLNLSPKENKLLWKIRVVALSLLIIPIGLGARV